MEELEKIGFSPTLRSLLTQIGFTGDARRFLLLRVLYSHKNDISKREMMQLCNMSDNVERISTFVI